MTKYDKLAMVCAICEYKAVVRMYLIKSGKGT